MKLGVGEIRSYEDYRPIVCSYFIYVIKSAPITEWQYLVLPYME